MNTPSWCSKNMHGKHILYVCMCFDTYVCMHLLRVHVCVQLSSRACIYCVLFDVFPEVAIELAGCVYFHMLRQNFVVCVCMLMVHSCVLGLLVS